jgi:hypothetical protein
MTLNWRGLGFKIRKCIHWNYGKCDKEWRGVILSDFTDVTITAKLSSKANRLNIETMMG